MSSSSRPPAAAASASPPDLQARALHLARTGGMVVCVDAPPRTVVGVDMLQFETGPAFRGVKLIPPGVHVLYSAANEQGVRTSVFLAFEAGTTYVLRWSKREECFELLDPEDGGEGERIAPPLIRAARGMELDKGLGAYPLDSLAKWKVLSSHITKDVVERVRPVGHLIHSDTDVAGFERGVAKRTAAGGMGMAAAGAAAGSAAAGSSEEPLIAPPSSSSSSSSASSPLSSAAGGLAGPSPAPATLFFSHVAGCGSGSRPEHRTQYAIDTSFALVQLARDLLARKGSGRSTASSSSAPSISDAEVGTHIIGELQIAFLLALVGQSYAALEQWKRLADVLCRAEDLLLGKYAPGTDIASSSSGSAGNAAAVSTERDVVILRVLGRSFFADAFAALRAQVATMPRDLIDGDVMSSDAFLFTSLRGLSRTAKLAARDEQMREEGDGAGEGEGEGEEEGKGKEKETAKTKILLDADARGPMRHASVRKEAEMLLEECKTVFGWEPRVTLGPSPVATGGGRGGGGGGSGRNKAKAATSNSMRGARPGASSSPAAASLLIAFDDDNDDRGVVASTAVADMQTEALPQLPSSSSAAPPGANRAAKTMSSARASALRRAKQLRQRQLQEEEEEEEGEDDEKELISSIGGSTSSPSTAAGGSGAASSSSSSSAVPLIAEEDGAEEEAYEGGMTLEEEASASSTRKPGEEEEVDEDEKDDEKDEEEAAGGGGGGGEAYASMSELLAALAAEGGDGDLPAFVGRYEL